jgi:hypothetical protein
MFNYCITMSKNRVLGVPESWYVSGGNRGFSVLTRTMQKTRNRSSALALPAPMALPPPSNNTNDGVLNNDDDDLLSLDLPTAVTNVSFSMDSHDRYAYNSGVSVTFSFTPTTASPTYVKLNYPPGFFSNYPTPSCTVSTQGTTMTPGVPGNSSITLSVTGTSLAAGSPVTVTLTGCKMGNSMADTNSITVQTDKDPLPSPSPALSSGIIEDTHKAKAFVITCIDFRLIDEAVAYLNSINLLNEYDEMIVAGASLGYNTSCNLVTGKTSTLWTECVDDHINISYALHHISQIIVIDHMSCGAYKYQLNGEKTYTNKYDEIRAHVKQLNDFRTTINAKYTKDKSTVDTTQIPKYAVKLLLMRLNGTVDINPTYWQPNQVSFNLNKNDVVVIGSQSLPNTIGNLPIPETTLQLLKYTAYADKGNYGNLFSVKYDENNVCYIQNDTDMKAFISDEQYYATSDYSYNFKLNDSLACINLTVTAPSDENATYVIYTFKSVDYF